MSAPLTDRDGELLNELEYFNDSENGRGARPLDLGGSNRSHHSGTLAKLAKRGLVVKKNWALGEDGRRHGDRGSCLYRITDAGRLEAKAWRTSKGFTQ